MGGHTEKYRLSIYHLIIIGVVTSSVFLFGATQEPVLSVEESIIIITFLTWWIREDNREIELTPIFAPFATFISIAIIQIIPLPTCIVKVISPKTVALKENLGIASKWTTISLAPALTVKETVRWISTLLLFILIVNLFRHRQQLKLFINALFALSVFEALYGIISFASGSHSLLWYKKPEYISNRVHGTYRNPDHFAGYMDMTIPLHMSQVLSWKHAEPYLTEEKSKKFLGIFLVAILSLSLFLSVSRAGIVSLITASTLWVLLKTQEEGSSKVTGYLWVFLILLGSYLLWMGIGPILDRFFTATSELERGRLLVWKDTMKMVKDFPVFGAGFGTYRYAFPMYKTFPKQSIWDHAHNDYIEFLAEGGIPMLLAFLWGAKRAVSWGIRSESKLSTGATTGIVAMLIHSFFDFNLRIPANTFVFFSLMAISWASRRRHHDRHSHPHTSKTG